MPDDISLQKMLLLRYSLPKIQWLIGAMSLASLLYLSSEEIWRISDSQPFPEVTAEGIFGYAIFFLVLLALANYFDAKRTVQRGSLAIAISLISIAVDLFFISSAEFVTLYTLRVLPQDISKASAMLLIGALPSSLGVVALSSLTAETLRKRARELHKEVQLIGKQVEELEKQRRAAIERLEQFEKKKHEFEKYSRKQGDRNDKKEE